MIYIEKNQKIAENENLRVHSPSGEYQDNDLIEVYDISNSELVSGAFAAQYIRYGGIVYKYNDPQALGREILNIDPTSTHSSASFVRMQDELLAKLNGGDLNTQTLKETVAEEMNSVEKKLQEESNLGSEDIQEKIEETKENIKRLEEESTLSNQTETIETTTSTSTPEIPTQTEIQNATSTSQNVETPITEATSTETLTTEPTSTEPIIIEEIIPEQPIEPSIIEQISPDTPVSILKRKNKSNIV